MSGEYTAFVYGTLMESRVFFRVVQGHPRPPPVVQGLYTFAPAILHDFCRHRVKGEDYPAIIPETGESVLGTYVTGLTEANMAKLDRFEGDEYERRAVKVRLVEKEKKGAGDAVSAADAEAKHQGQSLVKGDELKTEAYVFIYPERIQKGEWDFEHFRREKLQNWARDEIFFADDGLDDAAAGQTAGANSGSVKE